MSVDTPKIRYAGSQKNGIVLQSPRLPFLKIVTTRDKNDTIHSEVRSVLLDKPNLLNTFANAENLSYKNFRRRTLLANILLIDLGFWLTWRTLNIGFILAAAFWVIFVAKEFWIFSNVVYQMKSKRGSEHATARYHSAEHMVVDAYNQLGRVPSMAEAKTFSRFSKNCGSQETINHIVLSTTTCIFCCIAAKIPIFIYIPILLTVQGFCIFASKKGWFKFFQALITEEPTDSELEVAITSIINMQEMEEGFIRMIFEDDEELVDYDDDDEFELYDDETDDEI